MDFFRYKISRKKFNLKSNFKNRISFLRYFWQFKKKIDEKVIFLEALQFRIILNMFSKPYFFLLHCMGSTSLNQILFFNLLFVFNLLTPRNENFASHLKAYRKALLWALITRKLDKISIYFFVTDWDQG
jgi:hypothetical protein